MDEYKGNHGKKVACIEQLSEQDRNESLDLSNPKNLENNNPDSIAIDFVKDLQTLQEAIENNSLEVIQEELKQLPPIFLCCQPNEHTFNFLIESDIIPNIFDLFTNPPSLSISQSTLWLIITIYRSSIKFQKLEIIKSFGTLGLFDFLLSTFNPNYQKYLEGDVNALSKIDLNNFDIDSLPYYFNLFSYYCFLFNNEIRDIILNIIILPNRDIFFDDFQNNDLIIESSNLIKSSTFFPLEKDQMNYVNWIVTVLIQNFLELPPESLSYLLDSVLNLSQIDGFVPHLFEFRFESFLSKCINNFQRITNSVNDEIMNTALILQKKMLKIDPSRISINYEVLTDIINSILRQSKISASKLFQKALNLKKNDSPFDDDQFFTKFMDILVNCSYDIKSEYLRIIGAWTHSSSRELLSQRAPDIISNITPFLSEISVTDPLNLTLLKIIKEFFDNANLDPDEFQYLIEVFEDKDGIDFLEDIANDNDSPEENFQIAQEMLSIWS